MVSDEDFDKYIINSEPCEEYYIEEVKIENIHGKAWLFEKLDDILASDLYSEDTKRPLIDRLVSLFWLPTMPVIKDVYYLGNEKYLINDGCHRTYTAYIRGLKSVPCKISRKPKATLK